MEISQRAVSWMGHGKNRTRKQKTYESRNRLNVGNSENGGLAYVDAGWHDNSNDNLGFRVLAVLQRTDFNHPPTILPISRSSPVRAKYLL